MGLYDDRVLPHLLNVVMNNKQSRRIRARVCESLSGDVVEIGFGTGHNLPFVPATVSRLYAVEPSGVGVRLASERIEACAVDVVVVGLDWQRLAWVAYVVCWAVCHCS